MLMPFGADAQPGSEFIGSTSVVGALAVIAEVVGNLFPGGTMTCSWPRDCVGYFVEQNLVHLIVLILGSKMAGHRDALLSEVTQTSPRAGMVKAKAPHCRIQVQADESIRPLGHTFEISHNYFLDIWKSVLLGVGLGMAVESKTIGALEMNCFISAPSTALAG
jgi:hypothetical protein